MLSSIALPCPSPSFPSLEVSGCNIGYSGGARGSSSPSSAADSRVTALLLEYLLHSEVPEILIKPLCFSSSVQIAVALKVAYCPIPCKPKLSTGSKTSQDLWEDSTLKFVWTIRRGMRQFKVQAPGPAFFYVQNGFERSPSSACQIASNSSKLGASADLVIGQRCTSLLAKKTRNKLRSWFEDFVTNTRRVSQMLDRRQRRPKNHLSNDLEASR